MTEGDDGSADRERPRGDRPPESDPRKRLSSTSETGPQPPLGGRRFDDRVGSDGREGDRSAIGRVARSNNGLVVFVREMLVSIVVVVTIGMLLFAVSGVWPPMVAVESGSMEPHLQRGDLVIVMEEHRFAPGFSVEETGVVPRDVAEDNEYRQFGGYGDVIVYKPYGNDAQTPVIHRAHFYVEEGENWYERADPSFVEADSCEDLRYCPAPYAGFITKGDNSVSNNYYDQARGISTPVKTEWVKGTAEVRIPWLGWVRLAVSDTKLPGVASAVEATGGAGYST